MMKLTIILFIACLQVSAKGYAQKVTLSGKNVAFEKVFKEVGGQTGYGYAFINQLVKVEGDLTDKVEDAGIGEALSNCFKDQPLRYRIIDKGEEIEKQPVMNPLEAFGAYVNPEDIESIVVLKDADATAIYGSRANSGAILINTNKGEPESTKIDIKSRSSWSKVTQRLDLINIKQYIICPVRSGFKLRYSSIKSPITI